MSKEEILILVVIWGLRLAGICIGFAIALGTWYYTQTLIQP
jgi:hypothetical protein